MTRATLDAVHPILPTRDVRAALEYYVEKLGFTWAFADSPDEPRYAGIRRDGVELHLQWHDASEWEVTERPSLRFVASDVDALFAELADKGVFASSTELRDTAWGTREFAFFDPDQNGLTFYRDL